MWKWLGSMARGTTKVMFVLLSMAAVVHACTFLYRPIALGDDFATQFAISGVDVRLHFFIAGLALVPAPGQLSAGLRQRGRALHRLSGRLCTAAVLTGSLSVISLALHVQGGLPIRASFVLMARLWAGLTAIGMWRAMAGNFGGHRRSRAGQRSRSQQHR